jgi:hypothetical protein
MTLGGYSLASVDQRRGIKQPRGFVQERLDVQRDLHALLGIAGTGTGIGRLGDAEWPLFGQAVLVRSSTSIPQRYSRIRDGAATTDQVALRRGIPMRRRVSGCSPLGVCWCSVRAAEQLQIKV